MGDRRSLLNMSKNLRKPSVLRVVQYDPIYGGEKQLTAWVGLHISLSGRRLGRYASSLREVPACKAS